MPKATTSGGYLYRRGTTWWIAYCGIRRSLQTRNSRVAHDLRGKAIEAIDRELRGAERYSWEAAVGSWLTHATGQLARATTERYVVSLRVVAPILTPLMLDEIDRRSLGSIAHRAGVSNATRRRDLTAVAAVLRHAYAQGYIERIPAFDRSFIRERREPILLPPDAEVERFAAACPGATLPWLVRLLRWTGLRLEEAASLKWPEVDLQRRAVTLTRTKSNRVRVVPLCQQAVSTLSSTPRKLNCPWVFWKSGACDRYHHVDTYLMKVRRALGITWRTHDLRHLYAVRELQAGRSLYEIQQILGHSTIRVTEGYLDHLTPDEAARAKGFAG